MSGDRPRKHAWRGLFSRSGKTLLSRVPTPHPGSSTPGTPTAPQAAPGLSPSSLQVSPSTQQGRKFLEDALQALTPEEQATILKFQAHNSKDITTAVGAAIKAAQEKRVVCENKRWQYSFGKHNIILRDEADKVLSLLDRFTPVGDVVANVDPIHLGLPWAGIRAILTVAIADRDQMTSLVTGLNLALHMSSRLSVYFDFILHLPLSSAATTTLEKALVKMYALVLQFLAAAICIYQKSSAARTWQAFWKPSDIAQFKDECANWAVQVEIDTSNCFRELWQMERDTTTHWRKDLNEKLRSLDEIYDIKSSVEQTAIHINRLEQERLLNELPYADGAAFNSEPRRHETGCLPDTRVRLLEEIGDWIETGTCPIFWLNGMAGTGKSTIAWTVASRLLEQKKLAASFFFSRGAGDLGRTSKLVTTMARQLADLIPSARPLICEAIDNNGGVVKQIFRDQWRKLILEPMQALSMRPASSDMLVLVVDALDECGDDEDMRLLIQLFTESKALLNIRLRIFLTSRPETPIRLSFENIDPDLHQDLKLHNIARSDIQHDIFVYLQHEFARLSADWKLLEWPGIDAISELVRRSDRLFIYAATVCRFLRNPPRNPQKRLQIVLDVQTGSRLYTKQLDELYTQVLEDAFVGDSADDLTESALSFRQVVGCIVLLQDFLTAPALSRLISLPLDEVHDTLEPLHAVLVVPSRLDLKDPIRLLHPSFRDFLLDRRRCSNDLFYIDRSSKDADLLRYCLQVMSSGLKKDICELKAPGTLATEVSQADIDKFIPPELRYACSYWVQHLDRTGLSESNVDDIFSFLQKHLLPWTEALSQLGRTPEAVLMLSDLCSLVKVEPTSQCVLSTPNVSTNSTQPENDNLYRLVHDAHRFVLASLPIIELAPLQAYCAALLFSPSKSVVRQLFEHDIPSWITTRPVTSENWDSLKQTLEGHSESVRSVAFSPDGSTVVSGSGDDTVRLWDTATGKLKQTLEGHLNSVQSVAFSPDGSTVVSGSRDNTMRLWDTATGKLKQTLEGHSSWVESVAFSPDGSTVVSGSYDDTVRLWDTATGKLKQTLEGHSSWVESVAFSPDGSTVVSGSRDHTVRLWDTATGKLKQTLEGHSSSVESVAFSPDGSTVVSGSGDNTVRLWDTATGKLKQTLEGHSSWVESVAFSPDGSTVVSGSGDNTVRLWDTATGKLKQTLEGHSSSVESVAFSPDGSTVVSGSRDNTMRLWDTATGKLKQTLEGHSSSVESVAFSPDGSTVVSGSDDNTVRLWDTATGKLKQTLEGHSSWVESVAFSPDGSTVVSGSRDHTVRLWDTATGKLKQTLEGHSSSVESVAFSPDGSTVVSGSDDYTVRLWDTATGKLKRTLEGHSSWVESVAFSPDGSTVVSGSDDYTVRLWDTATGKLKQTLEGHSSSVWPVAFSPDGQLSPLTVDGRWITISGMKVVYLPESRQSWSTGTTAGYQDRLAVGSPSGLVSFYQFKLDEEHCV